LACRYAFNDYDFSRWFYGYATASANVVNAMFASHADISTGEKTATGSMTGLLLRMALKAA
jgi:hypothetical protein